MIGYALKTWKRIAFPALLFWVLAVSLLGSAGLTGWELHREKSQPYQLTVTATSALDPVALAQLADVAACTAVHELSGELTAGEYTAALIIYGVDSSFVEGPLDQGILFPDDSAMPYLVLNKAALKCFAADGVPIQSADGVDWLNCDAQLDGTPVRLCGILKEDGEEPRVYMSRSAARNLLLQAAEPTEARTAWVKLRNYGVLEQVTAEFAGLGYTWESAGTAAADTWPMRQMRAGLLALAGGISALAAASLLWAALRYDGLNHTPEYRHLRDVTGNRHIRGWFNLIRCAAVLVTGLLSGVALLLVLRTGGHV